MKLIHNHKLFLLMAICITIFVVALYAYMYYVVGQSTSRAILARDIVRVEALNKTQEQEIAALFEKTSADRNRLSSFIIPSDNVVLFIEALEEIGSKASSTVKISSISNTDNLDSAAPGTMGKIHVNVSVEGSWTSVMRTLQLVELLPYQSFIQNVKLDTSIAVGQKATRQNWQMSFDMTAVVMVPMIIK